MRFKSHLKMNQTPREGENDRHGQALTFTTNRKSVSPIMNSKCYESIYIQKIPSGLVSVKKLKQAKHE